MNFELSADQQLLVNTASSFVRRESPITRARKMRDDELGMSPALWKQMGDLGWLGLPFSEEHGGFGGTMIDASLIIEQLGTTLVPEPYVGSVVLAGTALSLAGDGAQRERWLSPMIAGDSVLALAYDEPQTRHHMAYIEASASKQGGGYRLDGQKRFVIAGNAASTFVVAARTSGKAGDAGGLSLFVVERGAKGVGVRPISMFDGRRGAVLTLEGVEVGADALLGAEGEALPVLEAALDAGAAAACAEGHGIMRAVLDMTTDYLRTREQFGVKIGSFQALQHRAVDMFVETELAKSTSIMAAIKLAEPDARERAAAISLAKAQLAQSGRFVTQQAIQLHGGIGITDEHDVGLYFKRMQVLLSLFGDEDFHLARYASLPAFSRDLPVGG